MQPTNGFIGLAGLGDFTTRIRTFLRRDEKNKNTVDKKDNDKMVMKCVSILKGGVMKWLSKRANNEREWEESGIHT